MDMSGNSESHSLDRDVAARSANARSLRNGYLRASCAKLIGLLLAALHGSKRRKLTSLSDRQLTDAGIDPAAAGRGKAVAAQPIPDFGGSR